MAPRSQHNHTLHALSSYEQKYSLMELPSNKFDNGFENLSGTILTLWRRILKVFLFGVQ